MRKGHGFKELDVIGRTPSDVFYVLHIDSSRADVDIIQINKPIGSSGLDDVFTLYGNKKAEELPQVEQNLLKSLRGEKVAVAPLTAQEVSNISNMNDVPRAYAPTEIIPITPRKPLIIHSDKIEVYKGHGLLPGDTIGSRPDSLGLGEIYDIENNGIYDTIVFRVPIDVSCLIFYLTQRPEDSSLSSDQLAKRNAYISKMQAS